MKIKTSTIVNTTTLDLGDVTLKNILGAKWLHNTAYTELSGMPQQVVINAANPRGGNEISEEFQLQGRSFEDRLKWVLGGFYFRNKYRTILDGTIQFAVPGSLTPPSASNPSIRNSYATSITKAVFGQATYELPWIEGLSVTSGVRYTWDERNVRVNARSNPTTCSLRGLNNAILPLAACELSGSANFSEPTYTFVVDYKAATGVLLYGSVSHGYRAGGINIASSTAVAFRPFEAETVQNHELGFKSQWETGGVSMTLNGNAYIQDYKDIQRNAQDPTNLAVSRLFNATAARITGGEAEFIVSPVRALRLGATYSLTKAKYTEPYVVAGVDISRNRFSLVPKHKFTLNGSYTQELGVDAGALRVGVDYYHQSTMYFDDVAQGPAAGPIGVQRSVPYGLTNFRIEWLNVLGATADLSLWVTNLTNKKFFENAINLYSSAGISPQFVNRPRFIGIDAKFRFGD